MDYSAGQLNDFLIESWFSFPMAMAPPNQSKIKALDEKVINQIAAGEVVERPASVVKELVENALDAGTDWVVVEILGGGLKLIKVADDGEGMSPLDARLAVQKHTTSKIHSVQDLSKLHTFGFRGEALASIASVSHFEMTTRLKNNLSGFQVKMKGGGKLTESEIGRSEGTTLSITNLFFNTPARLKFMKKQSTEENHILLVMSTYALAYPHIGFKLEIEGKLILNAPPGDFKTRLYHVFGKDMALSLIPLRWKGGDIGITGAVSAPTITKPTRENMLFFVNKRWISNPSLSHAVMTGFHTLLPTRRFPISVVFIEIPSDLVDVNVHPTKKEVKFARDREVYDAIVKAVRGALLTTSEVQKTVSLPNSTNNGQFWAPTSVPDPETTFINESNPIFNFSANNLGHYLPGPLTDAIHKNSLENEFQTDDLQARRIDPNVDLYNFSQLFSTFIIFQSDTELFIADQHTVHERLNYEKLMKGIAERHLEIQQLLLPVTVELNPREAQWLRNNMEILLEIGLDLSSFGGNTFVIRSVPSDLANKNLANLLKDLIEDLKSKENAGTVGSNRLDQIRERTATFFSCRSAVMAGDHLNPDQMKGLIDRMRLANLPFTCPHGRPTILSIPLSELYRKFDRH